ncbi:MAG TPA: glutaredoxin [Polyangiaceae bacterium]|jgi:glutaredoxin|nr:glutaredoxin [Polyangiaceae bacterium]
MPKLDWVLAVDRAIVLGDKVLDRLRKTPRKRLDRVPTPPAPPDPFVEKAAAPPKPEERPLGDAELVGQIYGKRSCMWSGRAQRIFQDLNYPARFIDLDDPDQLGVEARLVKETKRYETPYVYVRGEYIGGYHQLDELLRLGELEIRALPADERADFKKHSRIRIEKASRGEGPGDEPGKD